MSGTYKTAKQLEYGSRFAARESSKFKVTLPKRLPQVEATAYRNGIS